MESLVEEPAARPRSIRSRTLYRKTVMEMGMCKSCKNGCCGYIVLLMQDLVEAPAISGVPNSDRRGLTGEV